MTAVVRADLRKLLKRPGVRIIVLLWPALSLVFGYVLPYLIRNLAEVQASGADLTSTLLPASLVPNVLSGFSQFGLALAIILGGLAIGSEYGWNTMGVSLVQGPGRTAVHVGRLVALALVVLIMTLLTFAVSAIASVVIAGVLSESTSPPGAVELLGGIAGGWLVMGVGAVIGATLAVLFRSTALSIGLGLVYVLVIESVFAGFSQAADWVRAIARYLPGINAAGLANTFGDGAGGGPDPAVTDATHATIVLVAYLVVLTVVGTVVMRQRDVG